MTPITLPTHQPLPSALSPVRAERPVLFLLHALGGSSRAWDAMVTELGEAFETYAIDLPGFGDMRDAPSVGVADVVDHVMATIRARRASRWLLVGHSMGGKIASIVASHALAGEPGLFGLAGVVLLAASPPSPEPMQEDRRREMIGWAVVGPLDDAAARTFIDANVGQALPPAVDRLAVEDLRRASREAWLAWLERGSREDWSDDVGRLDLPALIIVGSADGDLGEAGQRATNALIYPRATLVVEEGAGHLLPLERPREVAMRIDRFWHDTAGTAPPIPPPFTRLIASSRVSRRTRAVLAKRALADRADFVPQALSRPQLVTLRAIAARVVPQTGQAIDLSLRLDAQLAADLGDGWRFADLPPDRQAYAAALDGLAGFEALTEAEQQVWLKRIAEGKFACTALSKSQMTHWFEDLCVDLVKIWVAHPATMARIGFDGFANGGDDVRKQGFERLAAGEREGWEPLVERAR